MITNLLTGMDIEYLERRTKKAIDKFGIENLMDYTVDSVVGCDIGDFYKTIVEEVLIDDTYVDVSEISDGKYEVSIEFEGLNRSYSISSNAWNTVETVVANLIDNIIIPHIKRGRTSCLSQYIV